MLVSGFKSVFVLFMFLIERLFCGSVALFFSLHFVVIFCV